MMSIIGNSYDWEHLLQVMNYGVELQRPYLNTAVSGTGGREKVGEGGGGGGGGRGGRRGGCALRTYTTLKHTSPPPPDASYLDPLGELPERPKTAARQRPAEDDGFQDADLGDDLLPE